eukprot:6155137-Prymnesium_polylepis.2
MSSPSPASRPVGEREAMPTTQSDGDATRSDVSDDHLDLHLMNVGWFIMRRDVQHAKPTVPRSKTPCTDSDETWQTR